MKRTWFSFLSFLLIPSLLSAEIVRPVRDVVDEAKFFAMSPTRLRSSDLVWFGGGAALIGTGFAFDTLVRRNLMPLSGSSTANTFKTFGDVTQFAGPIFGAGYLISGFSRDADQDKQFGWFLVESYGWASLFSLGLKEAVGRNRPGSTDNLFSFSPGHGSSFPSGHTTAAFSAATALAEHYDTWQVAVPSYAAATAVGFSRLYANDHWLSDVFAGAILGYAVSHALKHHRQSRNGTLLPKPDGLQVVWQW